MDDMLNSRMANGGAAGSRPVPIDDQVTDQWGRRERLITATRLLVAGVSVLTVTLNPSEPAAYARFAYGVMLAYTGYAVLTAVHAWTADAFTRWWPLSTHVLDLVSGLVVVSITDGSTSPLFALLLFPLLPAALRWKWNGALLTALVVTIAFIGVALVEVTVLQDPRFALNAVIVRLAYAAVLAIVLGYTGEYEEQSRRAIIKLGTWGASAAPDEDEFHLDLLGHVADAMTAPRVLLFWRSIEAVTMTAVEWAGNAVKESTEDVAALETVMAPQVKDTHFLCVDAMAGAPRVMYASSTGFQRWRGAPVSKAFGTRWRADSILSFRLHADGVVGRLFILDKRRLTIDDLTLGALVARQVEGGLEQRASLQRLRDAAVIEERARVARDVHDDVLQSMSALSLGLETVVRLMERAPERAREWLSELQGRLSNDQRALRTAITGLKRGAAGSSQLSRQLSTIARSLEGDWGLPVKLDLRLEDLTVPDSIGREIRLIVREAIVNAARHARASTVYLTVRNTPDTLLITVDDDGRGFPFAGNYDDAQRRQLGVGPKVLGERVEALGGALAITSSTSGARLDIQVPLV
jgi:signal transduction histidine kinase